MAQVNKHEIEVRSDLRSGLVSASISIELHMDPSEALVVARNLERKQVNRPTVEELLLGVLNDRARQLLIAGLKREAQHSQEEMN